MLNWFQNLTLEPETPEFSGQVDRFIKDVRLFCVNCELSTETETETN